MQITPSNKMALLGIGAAHRRRVELSDKLFFPVAVRFDNPAQPMTGGSVGNRGGKAVYLSSRGVGGNTGGYKADFNGLGGDPLIVIAKMTADGPKFVVADSTGQEIMVEDPGAEVRYGSLAGEVEQPPGYPKVGTTAFDYRTVPRYSVKADGVIYDLLSITGSDTGVDSNADQIPDQFQHWAVNNTTGTGTLGAYAFDGSASAPLQAFFPPGNQYTPPDKTTLTVDNWSVPVGRLSFRAKSGASSQFIQEQISQTQSALDSMSRLLRSLHDEAKGPFANLVLR